MLFPHRPMMFWSDSELSQLSFNCRKENVIRLAPLPVPCESCTFVSCCSPSFPCRQSNTWRFLPRLILTSLVAVGIHPKSASFCPRSKSFVFRIPNAIPLKLSMGLFFNGREVRDNLLLSLAVHPSFTRSFKTLRSRPSLRWKLQNKRSGSFRNYLDLENATEIELETKNETFSPENSSKKCSFLLTFGTTPE